jgi:hypothetical protein
MYAYVEARITHPDENDLLMVSLGTGQLTRKQPYDEAKGWGLTLWAQPILNVVFDGVADMVDFQLRELLPSKGGGGRCYRFQTELDVLNDDMDDASLANIQAFKAKARTIIDQNDSTLNALFTHLIL